jgi:hypothetical protein
MFEALLKLYDQSKVNPREPRCVFGETDLFNEGWLLRGVLAAWQAWDRPSNFPFLPFPLGSIVRSSPQIYTPFKKRKKKGDTTGEHNTRADAVAGHFRADHSKSGLRFVKGGGFFAGFEAKMYSGFSRIKNSAYSQLARTASCLVHGASEVRVAEDARFYLVTLFPADNKKISPAKYTKEFIETEIRDRVREYGVGGGVQDAFQRTLSQVWDRLQLVWLHWEEVVEEINDPHLHEFYRLCKKFGKAKQDDVLDRLIAAVNPSEACRPVPARLP